MAEEITVSQDVLGRLQSAMAARRPATIQLDLACQCGQVLLAHARWLSGTVCEGVRMNIYSADVICSTTCGFAQATGQTFSLRG